MCGIVGFIGNGDKRSLENMVASLYHRGPDDSGVYQDEKSKVGLGHTRLSILDVSMAGHQPMWDADKKIAIVFNGEIYNFAYLREILEATGKYRFNSKTDTEIIINLYREYGVSCFEKMEGMFAIALFDPEQKRLVLARDRMGKKPLYYGNFKNAFIFGSELKSLVLHPSFEKKLDLESVNKYLQFDYVPTPHTIWSGVRKLEPGSYLIFENNKIQVNSYWKPKFKAEPMPFEVAKEKLGNMIRDAVDNRLVADVPVGVFLSGGLDSSTIAYYAQKSSKVPIETFSIGFTEASFDESGKARKVADFLGTKHHEKIFTSQDCLDSIPAILEYMDEPMADASIVPTYLLSKFTKEHVTVALGGDGGDELFAGYPTFQADRLAKIYCLIPKMIRIKVLEPLIRALPTSFGNFSFDFKLKKFIDGFDVKDNYRHQIWLGAFGPSERKLLFKSKVLEELGNTDAFDGIDSYDKDSAQAELGNKMLYQYQKTYMMDEVLVKVDRATMMASLEARSPLLDYRIADFANSLPYLYKLHGFKTKYLLKELMKGKLPSDIVFAKKMGFGMPVAEWLRGPLKLLLEESLSRENIEKMGLFNYGYIDNLKAVHYSGKENRRKELWNLLVFVNWYKKWMN